MFDNMFVKLSTCLADAVYLLYHLKYILHDKVSITSILGANYFFFPNNSEWLPILTISTMSDIASIQIRRKSLPTWHSMQSL